MSVLTKVLETNGLTTLLLINLFVAQHSNSYPTDCTTSGTSGGALKCFTTSLKDGKLTVNKS